MTYCKLAKKIFDRDIICDSECPLIHDCPRLIMEDASDEAIDKAVDSLIGSLQKYWGRK